jgi:hypothetical protein
MNPQTAQAFADYTGCVLPTPMLVDTIQKYAGYKLNPETFFPVGHDNEMVRMFVKHNQLIEMQLYKRDQRPNRHLIVGGVKKDIVVCNKTAELPNKVAIYGWYYPDSTNIQPLYTGHVNWYVDYSHGIRLLNRLAFIDGKPCYIDKALCDPLLFKFFSNENQPMSSARYNITTDN